MADKLIKIMFIFKFNCFLFWLKCLQYVHNDCQKMDMIYIIYIERPFIILNDNITFALKYHVLGVVDSTVYWNMIWWVYY